jgi:hypothetical protein
MSLSRISAKVMFCGRLGMAHHCQRSWAEAGSWRLGLSVAPKLYGIQSNPATVRFFDIEDFDVSRMADVGTRSL